MYEIERVAHKKDCICIKLQHEHNIYVVRRCSRGRLKQKKYTKENQFDLDYKPNFNTNVRVDMQQSCHPMDNSHLTLEGGSIAKLYFYSTQALDKVTKISK